MPGKEAARFFYCLWQESGTLTIDNGLTPLTAKVNWEDIYTYGTSGGMTSGGIMNLSDVSYAGTVPDLLAIKNNPSTTVATFSFSQVPVLTLANLAKAGAQNKTSFSGSITAVPVPPSALLLGSGLLGLGLLRRRKIFKA